MKKLRNTLLFSIGLLSLPSWVQAESLKQILQHALAQDPGMDAARADIRVAESQTKISEAGHHPVVSLNQTGVLAQHHTYQNKRRSGPSVNGKINLYSWGAVDAEIESNKHLEDYYQHKFSETREQIGQKVGQFYLGALRAKENLAVYKESLARHNKLIADLKVIISYDPGRAFEMNEALSRKNQVESSIERQERLLHTNLSQLRRYTQKDISENALQDPFANMNTSAFLSRYQNKNATNNPTFLAQKKEYQSAEAAVKASEARRLPEINLEGSASRHEREIYVGVSWDIYNSATKHEVAKNYHSKAAAEARLREIELNVLEQARTAELEMARSEKLAQSTHRQIKMQRKVVEDSESQYGIAMKSLINVLDSYQDLSSMQAEEVAARNDYRDAALLYLASQARIANWAGFTTLNLSKTGE